MEHFVVHK